MAGVSIRSLGNSIEKQLDGMIKRANLVPAYLDRVVYRVYQAAQKERWETQNTGDNFLGGTWKPLDPAYEKWKKKKYTSSPGSGSKMLIRTKTLFDSVVGPHESHKKIVDSRSIRIATSVPYAIHVDEHRTFTQWSPKFYKDIYRDMTRYLAKNIVRTGF